MIFMLTTMKGSRSCNQYLMRAVVLALTIVCSSAQSISSEMMNVNGIEKNGNLRSRTLERKHESVRLLKKGKEGDAPAVDMTESPTSTTGPSDRASSAPTNFDAPPSKPDKKSGGKDDGSEVSEAPSSMETAPPDESATDDVPASDVPTATTSPDKGDDEKKEKPDKKEGGKDASMDVTDPPEGMDPTDAPKGGGESKVKEEKHGKGAKEEVKEEKPGKGAKEERTATKVHHSPDDHSHVDHSHVDHSHDDHSHDDKKALKIDDSNEKKNKHNKPQSVEGRRYLMRF